MKPFDVFEKFPIHITRGDGCYIYDDRGNEYLDMYCGHGVVSIGHGHPYFIDVVSRQLNDLSFYSNTVENSLQEVLAYKLGEMANYPTYQVFFSNSGAEANENAIKLASFHTKRSKVLAFDAAFHGRTSATVSATDNQSIRAPVNENLNFVFVALNDINSLRNELETRLYCSVIVEGIQGVGGVNIPNPHFLEEVKRICEATGTLLILDEIQSGYGRTGKFFAHQYSAVCPDLITVAKGIANGFPMAGTLIHPKIKPWKGMLGSTFGGNHLACAAALSVLKVMEEEALMENAAVVGNFLMEELSQIPGVHSVRGKGLMIGLEFHQPMVEIRNKLLKEGFIFTGSSGNHIMRLLPPLTFRKQHCFEFLTKLKELLIHE